MATPRDEMWAALEEEARQPMASEVESAFDQFYGMTVGEYLKGDVEGDRWPNTRDWVLKQMGKIARDASSRAEQSGGQDIGAADFKRACNKLVPRMHDACVEVAESRGEGLPYGPICPLFVLFVI